MCEQACAGRQEWGEFSACPHPSLTTSLVVQGAAVLPHPSTPPVNPSLHIKFSPHPPRSSNSSGPQNALLLCVSLPLTEIKGSAPRKVSCSEHWKWGKPTSVLRHEHSLSRTQKMLSGRDTEEMHGSPGKSRNPRPENLATSSF